MNLLVLVLSLLSTAVPTSVSAPPWSGAALVPSDVDFFLHVNDPSGLRREAATIPIADALSAVFSDDEVRTRWAKIAGKLGCSGEQCFDDLFGEDVVLAIRHKQQGSGTADWVLATRIDPETWTRVSAQLNPKAHGRGLMSLPCQGLAACWREPTLFIGPALASPLFNEAITRSRQPAMLASGQGAETRALAGEDGVPSTSLADRAIVRDAQRWSVSHLQMYMRSSGWLAGESVVTALVERGRAEVRSRHRLAALPMVASDPDAPPVDSALLARFDGLATLATMRRLCDGPTAAMLREVMPELAPCDEMRRNSGDRAIIVIGDVDGGAAVPCRVPALAIAIEMRDPCEGRRLHEVLVHRAVEGFNARYARQLGGAITPPEVAACADVEDPRHCDLSRPIRILGGDHPLVRTCSLHWRTVAGDDGAWQVYATHRPWLDRVARRLECAEQAAAESAPSRAAGEPPMPEGFLVGTRAAAMVRSWRNSADSFGAKDPIRFRAAIDLLASLLGGVDRASWSIERPDARTLDGRLRIDFARPAPSAP